MFMLYGFIQREFLERVVIKVITQTAQKFKFIPPAAQEIYHRFQKIKSIFSIALKQRFFPAIRGLWKQMKIVIVRM